MQDLLLSNLPAQLGVLGVILAMFFWLLRKVMADASAREERLLQDARTREDQLMEHNKEMAEALAKQSKAIDRLGDVVAAQGERLRELTGVIEKIQHSVDELYARLGDNARVA